MAKLVIGEAAEAEYQAAAEWYAQRSPAVADGFTEAVAAAFRRILDRPGGARHVMMTTGS